MSEQVAPPTDPTPEESSEATASTQEAPAAEESRYNTDDPDAPRIPQTRLDSEVKKRHEAETQAQQLQQQVEQLQQYILQNQQAPQPAETPQAAPAPTGMDPTERYIREQLGTDEQGQKAYELLENYFSHKTQTGDFITRAEAQKLVDQAKQATLGRFSSTVQTANRFQKWVDSGMVDPKEAAQLQGQLNQILRQHPQLADDENNMKYVVSHLLTEGLENGTVQRHAPARPKAPVPTPANGQGPVPPEFKADQSPFQRVRNLKPERVKALEERSRHNWSRAQ